MSNEIKCPNCGEVIQLDESDYAAVARQIRDKEFEKELSRRAEELRKQNDAELQLKLLQQAQEGSQVAAEVDNSSIKLLAPVEHWIHPMRKSFPLTS